MKWTKNPPNKPGLYWCRCTGYGKLFTPGEVETDIICEVEYSDSDKCWTVTELGGDYILNLDDELGVDYWSDERVERPVFK